MSKSKKHNMSKYKPQILHCWKFDYKRGGAYYIRCKSVLDLDTILLLEDRTDTLRLLDIDADSFVDIEICMIDEVMAVEHVKGHVY